jgi:hypothetical protein
LKSSMSFETRLSRLLANRKTWHWLNTHGCLG